MLEKLTNLSNLTKILVIAIVALMAVSCSKDDNPMAPKDTSHCGWNHRPSLDGSRTALFSGASATLAAAETARTSSQRKSCLDQEEFTFQERLRAAGSP